MNPLQHRSEALPAGRDCRSEIALLAAGIVTMAFGLLALLGWVSGWLRLASFGANMIPMAPSTAVLFLLYGAAIGLRARTPLSRRAFRFSVALAGLGTLIALLLFTLGWLHIQWAGEHLGLNVTGTVGGALIGHMSLVTAFCFLLAGGSFLASLAPAAPRPWRVGLALVSAGVLLATSFIFLLAYGLGTPLLYGGAFIPPALNTILAFFTLGLALLTLAGRPAGLFRGSPGADSKPAFFFALIFLLLTAGIVTGGYAYYRNFERHFRAEAGQQLAAIAELKVHELMQWRQERMGDGGILFRNAAFSALVRRVLEKPADTDAQQQVRSWLAKYATLFGYDEVRLLDAQGVTRLSAPAGLPAVSTVVAAHAAEASQSGQVALQDFFRSANDGKIHLAILIPILDEADGDRPLGVLVLRIDPSIYLYPFISRWPVPSATAETLLVRREGNEVVFLNELRFQTNSALTLRRSLANTNLPAAKAALGQEGIVEGVDYRGVPVLAALRAVPDSPWRLVARRDAAEVYALLRAQLWQVIALVGVLLFGAGAGVSLIWRQQRVRFYQKEAELAEMLRESSQRLEFALEGGELGIWDWCPKTGAVNYSARWARLLGYPPGEVEPTVDFFKQHIHPEDLPTVLERLTGHVEGRLPVYASEHRMRTKPGGWKWFADRGKVAARDQAGHPIRVSGVLMDITERKQAEAALQKFAMLADSSSEFIGMCDLNLQPYYVNAAGLRMVGLPDMAAACRVKVQDYFFPEDQRFIGEEFFPRVLREGHGDVETRLRHFQTGEPIWMFYYLFSVRDASGEIVGWATVSRDITARKRAEADAQREQVLSNTIIDSIPGTFYLLDEQGRYTRWNTYQRDEILGKPEEQIAGMNAIDTIHPEDRALIQARIVNVLRDGKEELVEGRVLLRGGPAFIWMLMSGRRMMIAGRPFLVGTGIDITARKQAEEAMLQRRQAALNLMRDAVAARDRSEQMGQALRESEENYRTLFREMQNGFAHSEIICDAQGRPVDSRYLAVNPAFERIMGRKAEAVVGQTILEVFPALEPGWLETFGRVALTGESAHFEMRAAELGVTFDVSAFQPAPNQYACTFSDITARKRAEAELGELNRSLEQRVQERTAELRAANQELEAFAYAVSHDLRQPLRAMNGFSQALVEDHGATLPGEARAHLDEIILGSRRMSGLIDGLLRLSRSTRGELRRDAVDLSALAARTLGELAAAEPERHVMWTVAPGLTARGDERMIEVVLANLLGNAWKYTAKTPQPEIEVGQIVGPLPSAGVIPSAASGDAAYSGAFFFIRDNGAGFDMKHAARLFQPFQRLHRQDEFPGLGIGLATVQRIVHRHGGTIRATAAPGQGATFVFSLSASGGHDEEEL